MKINLLYNNKDIFNTPSYPDSSIIIQDLNLTLIFDLATRKLADDGSKANTKDDFIRDTMKKYMMMPLMSEEDIYLRQKMLDEAAANMDSFEDLYEMISEAYEIVSEYARTGDKLKNESMILIEKKKYLTSIIEIMLKLVTCLDKFKNAPTLISAFAELKEMLTEEFVDVTNQVLEDLDFVLSGGKLSLHTSSLYGLKADRFFIESLELTEFKEKKKSYSQTMEKVRKMANKVMNPDVHELDNETLIADARALENAAASYIISFYKDFIADTVLCFKNLKSQAAFILGGARLAKRFDRFNVPICYPKVVSRDELNYDELLETCLCIYQRRKPVGNAVESINKPVFVITGANQGGKSTYLRSIGLAQVMMQAGMFVTAKKYESGLYSQIFTHFTRREDSSMNSGRLDEELRRMSGIVDRLKPDSMILLNESFATTTEKEGSDIAMSLTEVILKSKIRMLSVTHLLEYAHALYEGKDERVLYLSAGRREDGSRSFKINPHPPEDTSYGLDLYDMMIN